VAATTSRAARRRRGGTGKAMDDGMENPMQANKMVQRRYGPDVYCIYRGGGNRRASSFFLFSFGKGSIYYVLLPSLKKELLQESCWSNFLNFDYFCKKIRVTFVSPNKIIMKVYLTTYLMILIIYQILIFY
jgi:hypothetical protein